MRNTLGKQRLDGGACVFVCVMGGEDEAAAAPSVVGERQEASGRLRRMLSY